MSETHSPSGQVSATVTSRFTAAEAASGTFGTMDRATITELLDRTRYLDQTGQLVHALKAFIGDTSDANVTVGLTINQGAADDVILALKSSDVAHGMTTLIETDSYGALQKAEATSGGLDVRGFKDADGVSGSALVLSGFLGEAADTTKSTGAVAAITIDGYIKSGTTSASVGANGNILSIRDAGSTTRFIFDADGDSHQDVGTAWTNF